MIIARNIYIDMQTRKAEQALNGGNSIVNYDSRSDLVASAMSNKSHKVGSDGFNGTFGRGGKAANPSQTQSKF